MKTCLFSLNIHQIKQLNYVEFPNIQLGKKRLLLARSRYLRNLAIYLFIYIMRYLISIQIILWINIPSIAQLHDNNWIFGYSNNFDTLDKFGISIISFTDGKPIITQNNKINFNFNSSNASFSDSSGNFHSYTNGIHIGNKAWEIMENGSFIQKGSEAAGEVWPQFCIALPWPEHPDKYFYLFEKDTSTGDATYAYSFAKGLYAAIIEEGTNNGLGKVINRNIEIIQDTLALGKISATKHANGRDWWILINKQNSNQFYTVLLTPEGAKSVIVQTIGQKIIGGVGQGFFSPNGQYYGVYNGIGYKEGSDIFIYKFDRCLGVLSEPSQFHFFAGDWGGLAFSPNSRYLYVNYGKWAYQYDILAPDLWASRKTVATWDGTSHPFPTGFFFMQLAPDGKIYSCPVSGSDVLHVIHESDEPGMACRYEQHAIQLPTYNDQSIPNFPNYRLGPLDGSPCDTLGLDNLPKAWFRYEQDTLDPLRVAFRDLSYYEPASWSWDFGDPASGGSSTERHPGHQYDKAGIYQVCLTVSNTNGTDTHCKTLYLGVSAQDNPVLQAQVSVWPNPFHERLAISLSAGLPNPVFRLFDMTGRLVREQRLGLGVNEIPAVGLTAGMYFWALTAGSERVRVGKVVKYE